MSSSSNHDPSQQSDVDEAADFVDQYLDFDKAEADSVEEQEDVGLYTLYENRTPWPCLKSPTGAILPSNPSSNTSLDMPIDQEILTKKLRNYMESISCSSKSDSGLDPHEHANHCAKGCNLPAYASDIECGGPTTKFPRANDQLCKN